MAHGVEMIAAENLGVQLNMLALDAAAATAPLCLCGDLDPGERGVVALLPPCQ